MVQIEWERLHIWQPAKLLSPQPLYFATGPVRLAIVMGIPMATCQSEEPF